MTFPAQTIFYRNKAVLENQFSRIGSTYAHFIFCFSHSKSRCSLTHDKRRQSADARSFTRIGEYDEYFCQSSICYKAFCSVQHISAAVFRLDSSGGNRTGIRASPGFRKGKCSQIIFIDNIKIALFLFIITSYDDRIGSEGISCNRRRYSGTSLGQFFINSSNRNSVKAGSAKFFRDGYAEESLSSQFIKQAFMHFPLFIHFSCIRYDFFLHQIPDNLDDFLLFLIKSKIHIDTNLPFF